MIDLLIEILECGLPQTIGRKYDESPTRGSLKLGRVYKGVEHAAV